MLYQDNPFKLLGVLPTDGRREIVRQAEEKSLLLDAQKCSDARTTLTNPQRRINAEIHWFLDCQADEIKEIEEYISAELAGNTNGDFEWEKKSALTQLNIQLACIGAQNFGKLSSAKFYILGISRLYESIDAEKVIQTINETRKQAGFPEVAKSQDIDAALNELRSEIRQMLSGGLQKLSRDKYIQIVTKLSESYSGTRRYKGNAVLEDLISEYQLYINDALHEQGQAITKTAQFVARGAKKIDVSRAVSDLIDRLYAWDKLAQPLQLGALTKGSSHDESKEMLRALRDLALKLHNEYSFSEESLAITKATQEVFKELPEYADMLSEDNEALTRIIGEKETEEVMGSLLDNIKDAYEVLKNCPESQREAKTKDLITYIKNANTTIKKEFPDQKDADELRSTLGMVARSFAIELHNDFSRTEDAVKIINAIEPLFSDLSNLSDTLGQDKKTLNEIWNEQKNTDIILSELKEIEKLGNQIKQFYLANNINGIEVLISKTDKLNSLIKSSIRDIETRNKARENLAYMVRDVGIELHNKWHNTPNALKVINGIKPIFADMPNITKKLNEDSAILDSQMIGYQNTMAQRSRQSSGNQSSKGVGGAVVAVLILLGIIIAAFSSNSSSTKTAPTISTPRPTTYSTPKPTATPKLTAKPTPRVPEQSMPANGTVLYCSSKDTPSTFTVRNGGKVNYYMKFVKAGTNTKVITFFVRPNCTATIDMPAGNLELRYAYAPYGSHWYGERYLFGDDTLYAKDEDYYDFTNYTWEISLDSSLYSGTNMDVEYIDEDEF